MNSFQYQLSQYAMVTLKVGINLQPGQCLIIRSQIENAPLVRELTKKAYQLGASNVIVDYSDEELTRLRVEEGAESALTYAPSYIYDAFVKYAQEGAAFLSISSQNPDLFAGLAAEKVGTMMKSLAGAMHEFRDYIKAGKVSWNIIAAATPTWAKKVYPTLGEEEAVKALWKAIFSMSRVDQVDPIQAWKNHIEQLNKRLEYLNQKRFKYLRYTSANGTNICVELPEKHCWLGGALRSTSGVDFVPNIPTEEVFTLPKKESTEGIVYGSKPLNYNGSMIQDYYLRFHQGKVVEYDAKIGKEALKNMIELDDNASFLGEVALVPHHSPISNMETLFFNILIDENASCHFAVGSAYPMNLEGGTAMSQAELIEAGANISMQHVDFMIGTKDLSIVGETRGGESIVIFDEGNFII